MNWDYPPGATPLDPDEAEGLIRKHIVNHGQLNEWEFQNVLEGERWAFGRKRKDILKIDFIRSLRQRASFGLRLLRQRRAARVIELARHTGGDDTDYRIKAE